MTYSFGPRIVSDDLVFLMDVANHQSFVPGGSTINDLISKRIGTLTSVTTDNNHLNFDGANSYIDMGILSSAQEKIWEGGGTFMAWIRAESDGEFNTSHIYNATNGLTDGTVVWVSDESSGAINFRIWIYFTGNNGQYQTNTRPLTLNQWHHIAITYDSDNSGTAPIFYVDAVPVTIQTNLTPSGDLNDDVGNTMVVGNNSTSGGSPTPTRTFDGDIDLIGLYKRALSQEEVAQNYNALKGRFGL